MEKEMVNEFEDYLQDIHGAQYVGLDDEMPEDFNEWLQDLDVDTWIEYGAEFAFLIKNIGGIKC